MKKKYFRIWRWLTFVLMMLLVTACGKTAQSQSAGLVVVDSVATSKNENGSSIAEESKLPVSDGSSGESSVFSGENAESNESPTTSSDISVWEDEPVSVREDGTYTSKEEVAAYLHRFGHLPSNYITKTKAKKLGWDSSGKNLWVVAPGKSIGGGYFGNMEGILPEGEYRECDIDFDGKRRGIKRLVYSEDGRIYYTDDHYETFERLY